MSYFPKIQDAPSRRRRVAISQRMVYTWSPGSFTTKGDKFLIKTTVLAQSTFEPQVKPYGVSIVIPAHNEEQGLGLVLTQLQHLLDNATFPCEIIVVDDGSLDKTGTVAGQFSRVVVLRHNSNRGYGAALKTAIRHARYPLICITDADGTYPNELIPALIEQMAGGEYDMVVGARTGRHVAIPFSRRPAKWALNQLANLVAGEPIPDINSGLRVFKRNVALRFFHILPDGFSFTTTITLATLTNGYLVGYVPINYHPRLGQSKIRPIRDTLNFVQLILRIALYFAPLKIFLPLSGLLLLLALGWGLFSRLVLQQLADVSTLIIGMTAVQVAVVGLLAELINRRLPDYQQKYD